MKRIVIPLLVVAGLTLAACSGSPSPSGPTAINVKAEALKFNPATIEVVAGQPATLNFQNADSVDHDFSVLEIPVVASGPTQEPMAGHSMGEMGGMEPDLHVAAKMGESARLEFTVTEPGTYEFFCTVPGHKEAGMTGTLVVKAQ